MFRQMCTCAITCVSPASTYCLSAVLYVVVQFSRSVGFWACGCRQGRKCGSASASARKNCLSCCPFPTRALLLSNNHELARHHQHQTGPETRDDTSQTTKTAPLTIQLPESKVLSIHRDFVRRVFSTGANPYYYISLSERPLANRVSAQSCTRISRYKTTGTYLGHP